MADRNPQAAVTRLVYMLPLIDQFCFTIASHPPTALPNSTLLFFAWFVRVSNNSMTIYIYSLLRRGGEKGDSFFFSPLTPLRF